MEEGKRTIDYDTVIKNLEENEIEESSFHIIIDEGQDKPEKYYESLMCFGIENFFIVADQNQQITEDNSSRQELTDLLGLEVEDVIELKENYRNSYPIGLLSSSFFTDPSSPAPELPSKSKISLGVPILYDYENYQSCVKLILREADRDNRNLIGVIVANDELRDTYVNSLNSMEINLDNPRAIISTYSSKDKKNPNIDFSYSGIVVLNDKSIKGLEFDIVFIIIDGFKIYNNDSDSMKKRFYVMSSRAIKKLVFFKHKDYRGGVEEILPTDENILKRERLNNG
jgi:superfamily I DNA/RNA helicase